MKANFEVANSHINWSESSWSMWSRCPCFHLFCDQQNLSTHLQVALWPNTPGSSGSRLAQNLGSTVPACLSTSFLPTFHWTLWPVGCLPPVKHSNTSCPTCQSLILQKTSWFLLVYSGRGASNDRSANRKEKNESLNGRLILKNFGDKQNIFATENRWKCWAEEFAMGR